MEDKITVVRKRGVRRISLRVDAAGQIILTLPWFVTTARGLAFAAGKAEWIEAVRTRIRAAAKQQQQEAAAAGYDSLDSYVEVLRARAKRQLPARLAELAGRYGFQPSQVRIKHNRSNWGSCSARGNINLNLNLVRVAPHLRDYVLLHELCHLRHANHGPAFHSLLESLCEDLCRRDYPHLAGNYARRMQEGALHLQWRRELKNVKFV